VIPHPLVSIGVPTYNRPSGLRRTLQCLTTQSYTNLEILVSDNSSPTGEPEEVVHEFMAHDSRITYHRQSQPLPVNANFRFVLDKAQGPLFMWAADDDEWDEGFVSECVAAFRDDVVSVMPHMRTLYRVQGEQRKAAMPPLPQAGSAARRMAAFLRRLNPSLFYGLHRREAVSFFSAGGEWFDFYDCYFVLRLLACGRIAIIEPELYTAGVDAAAYQVKAAKRQRMLGLDYGSFYRAVSALIPSAAPRAAEQLWLRAELAAAIARLFMSHEPRFLWRKAKQWA
jgi:glycosyltransferase involved in cell wall biosynthesis